MSRSSTPTRKAILRSRTSLIQTIGRAARNVDGRAILYADKMTDSINAAIEETNRRREKQKAYNEANGITPESGPQAASPTSWRASTSAATTSRSKTGDGDMNNMIGHNLKSYMADLESRMKAAAADLEFEEAARLRDELRRLEAMDLGLEGAAAPAIGLGTNRAIPASKGSTAPTRGAADGRGKPRPRRRKGP